MLLQRRSPFVGDSDSSGSRNFVPLHVPLVLDLLEVRRAPLRDNGECYAPEKSSVWISPERDLVGGQVRAQLLVVLDIIPNILDGVLVCVHLVALVLHLVVPQHLLLLRQDVLQEAQAAVLEVGQPDVL